MESLWAPAFPSFKHTGLPLEIWSLQPILSFGEISTPAWFPLDFSSTPHHSSSRSPQVHQCQNVRPTAGEVGGRTVRDQGCSPGVPPSLLGRLALKHSSLKASLRLASHHYRLRGKDFLVLFSVWVFYFRSAVLLCLTFVYWHQSPGQLCLFADLSFP